MRETIDLTIFPLLPHHEAMGSWASFLWGGTLVPRGAYVQTFNSPPV